MSGFLPTTDNTVQYLTLPNTTSCTTGGTECVFATPAYWSGTVYIATAWGPVMALQLSNGLIPANAQVAIAASQSADTYAYPNPTPVISASPSGGAIVWALDNNANGTDDGSAALGPAILRAYDATNLATTLYSSATLSADTCGNAGKFTLPVVANGHVYVAGTGRPDGLRSGPLKSMRHGGTEGAEADGPPQAVPPPRRSSRRRTRPKSHKRVGEAVLKIRLRAGEA